MFQERRTHGSVHYNTSRILYKYDCQQVDNETKLLPFIIIKNKIGIVIATVYATNVYSENTNITLLVFFLDKRRINVDKK